MQLFRLKKLIMAALCSLPVKVLCLLSRQLAPYHLTISQIGQIMDKVDVDFLWHSRFRTIRIMATRNPGYGFSRRQRVICPYFSWSLRVYLWRTDKKQFKFHTMKVLERHPVRKHRSVIIDGMQVLISFSDNKQLLSYSENWKLPTWNNECLIRPTFA